MPTMKNLVDTFEDDGVSGLLREFEIDDIRDLSPDVADLLESVQVTHDDLVAIIGE